MIVLRPMQQADIESVMNIAQVVCDFPWTYSIYSDCIKIGYSCWVLDDETVEEIAGYGVLSVAAKEGHILEVCIKPERQRQGLGRRMMQHLLAQAKLLHAESVYLEVRKSNQAAFKLYTQLGFSMIGERKDYYPAIEGREDALVLSVDL